MTVGRGTEIKGDVTTRGGSVDIGPGVKVWGDVVGADVGLHENATVDGTIRASGEMQMHTDEVIDRPDETAEAMAAAAEELADDQADEADEGDETDGDGETGAQESALDDPAVSPTDGPDAQADGPDAEDDETVEATD